MIGKVYIIFLICVCSTFVCAQHMPLNTQYMYQGLLVNPGITGSMNAMQASFTYRNQALGTDIAPKTGVFSLHSSLKKESLGVGVQVLNQSFYELVNNAVSGFFSYGIYLGKLDSLSRKYGSKGSLRFGLKVGMVGRSFNWDQIQIQSREDPEFQDFSTQLFPTLGAGIYYKTDKIYFGYSIPEFINTLESDIGFKLKNWNQVIMAGYSYQATDDISLLPYFLVRMIGNTSIQTDFTAIVRYKKIVDLGLIMRSGFRFIGVSADVTLAHNIQIGYSYDVATNSTYNFNSYGNHELSLGYSFKQCSKGVSTKFF